jgi:hypothetical protein
MTPVTPGQVFHATVIARRRARGETVGNAAWEDVPAADQADLEAGAQAAITAGATAAAARELLGNFLTEYGGSGLPEFKIAQDLAGSVLKILDGGGP